ncbi:MAG: bifunctional diaminohydroxyphosphoribosylaminopyrimidine deaminase/5-amino-6-(5-phosphoribosylamino)uracil reductase RibD [Marinobacter sp.]|uniref:bifunctional diaminohydroxyphosphoribosylaminopyrimidine deaminase/5-amino-6-(5-phosphoribosylamino)uracil reductase RibD n=1 Tax=Marinobacter sp. TaxID=50741 RepID=UPI00299E1500|nr:bifunctional diaminohydroxyphosphoribosylaminopyrimidine deaminase/5-amino-6-(5-phosphoribosylamino)uracil reductase RibD [Marinobacter sp.]MDX1755848.1 bifunctional diaminohydroxyphosphoribosylaminopyrimidine deaminase/5-amino-6-(5-phosphoribosylamino)uracil reductase RibD [Marinobacter sp.]
MTGMTHEHFMTLALAESKKALPTCRPNPPVGCVLVREGEVVAKGYTQAPGRHHAEAEALAQWDGPASGLTAYVTLEPCSFHGRTPSCAETLIHRNIGTVVVAITDPDPRNSGKGLVKLREAGIEVVEGVCAEEVQAFLGEYLLG